MTAAGPVAVDGDPVSVPMGKGPGAWPDELGARLDALADSLERLVAGVGRLGDCLDVIGDELRSMRDGLGG